MKILNLALRQITLTDGLKLIKVDNFNRWVKVAKGRLNCNFNRWVKVIPKIQKSHLHDRLKYQF